MNTTNNAVIAAHLRSLATERAAAGNGFSANRYLAAALSAAASTQDVASLDSAGVQAALGCRDKIASEVLRVTALLRVLDLADSGDSGAAAELAKALTGDVPAVLKVRVARAIVAMQRPAHQRMIQFAAMADAAVMAERAGDAAAAAKFERVAQFVAGQYPAEFTASASRTLSAVGRMAAQELALAAVANPAKVQDAPVARPDRRVAVGCRTLTVLDGGAVA